MSQRRNVILVLLVVEFFRVNVVEGQLVILQDFCEVLLTPVYATIVGYPCVPMCTRSFSSMIWTAGSCDQQRTRRSNSSMIGTARNHLQKFAAIFQGLLQGFSGKEVVSCYKLIEMASIHSNTTFLSKDGSIQDDHWWVTLIWQQHSQHHEVASFFRWLADDQLCTVWYHEAIVGRWSNSLDGYYHLQEEGSQSDILSKLIPSFNNRWINWIQVEWTQTVLGFNLCKFRHRYHKRVEANVKCANGTW